MSQELESKPEPSATPEFFGKRGSWRTFHINDLKEIISKLMDFTGDFMEIKEEFRKLTGCDYSFDGNSYEEELIKTSNFSIIKEHALDIVVCYFDEFEIEFEVYMNRVLLVTDDDMRMVPKTAKDIDIVGVNIKPLPEEKEE